MSARGRAPSEQAAPNGLTTTPNGLGIEHVGEIERAPRSLPRWWMSAPGAMRQM